VIARVVPLTTTRALKGLFDYRLNGAAADAQVGSVLAVSFANRKIHAVVAELAETSDVPAEKLSSATELLPQQLPADLVELAIWMAAEYCSTPARALQVLLPAGALRGLREKQALTASITEAGTAALEGDQKLTPGQRDALIALTSGPRTAAQVGTPVLRRLEARGLVLFARKTVQRRPHVHGVSSTNAPALTAEQRAALVPITDAIASRRYEKLLLHGVTGSGKTEVYLQAAEATIKQGRTVIILVPEIGLTPQALQRFQARFGDTVAVLHSGLSDGQRHDEWLRLRRGEATVAVGPRSAIFAPLDNIGLIVVDEEHESSYKHEGDPRYDGRTVAEQRAKQFGATVLLGSATPRPETYASANRLRLAQRVDGRPLPPVEILDMSTLHNPLHPATTLALADTRRNGGKAIVLLNRRGWSNFLTCGSCGRVWMCPNCEVALVLHRETHSIACHHCGHHQPVPRACPDCGSVSVARHGAGTERLEHELTQVLNPTPDFPILRMDADSAGLDRRAETLTRFQDAPAGVLIGTQMIAKGHDFSDVGLGVVIDADQTLRFPDFRAEERTFSLVTQLAGRAGRGGDGRVLVQTSAPTARPILLAAKHDSDTFLTTELERRKALDYPPYSTLIRIITSHPDAERAEQTAQAIRRQITSGRTLGPAPLFMLRNKARAQLQIRTHDRPTTIKEVGAAVDTVVADKTHKDVSISVDVDPQ
jgi:primosomal protein N' (replication factor Y)